MAVLVFEEEAVEGRLSLLNRYLVPGCAELFSQEDVQEAAETCEEAFSWLRQHGVFIQFREGKWQRIYETPTWLV
jgi:hypothetical protein